MDFELSSIIDKFKQ